MRDWKRLALPVSIAICVAAITLAPKYQANDAVAVLWIEIAALAVLMIAVGSSVTTYFWGILINERNVMSLTRFQAVLWTILVLADFATVLLIRAFHSLPTTAVQIQPELLALMGISYASAVGSSIVNANKSGMQTPDAALEAAKNNLGDSNADFTAAQGVLYKNKDISDARISDMFQGDELADTHTIDMGKVQMFFFTIVSAVVFIGMAKGALTNVTNGKLAIDTLIPTLPPTLIALMGISHGAYLGNKAVTRTQQQPSVQAQAQVQVPLQPPAQPSVVTSTARRRCRQPSRHSSGWGSQ